MVEGDFLLLMSFRPLQAVSYEISSRTLPTPLTGVAGKQECWLTKFGLIEWICILIAQERTHPSECNLKFLKKREKQIPLSSFVVFCVIYELLFLACVV